MSITQSAGPRFADDPDDEVGAGCRSSGDIQRRVPIEQEMRAG